ncbi:MAG: bifunctional adenosylcobinamide kinase/adenosylcobinamide-phosphate guanylyltransferase [Deltaproteobacteria bacterium]|nr:bifunctional adenosylcobinamide kinase/adenosylcobinamide-phosphate guanylyltransferase [Deltaproteobacteria bacterium]
MTVDFTSTKTTSRRVVLLTGGARAGKSRRALEICAPYPTKIFCATATAMDDEMAARINAHQAERGAEWTTVEEPLDPAAALSRVGTPEAVVVVDCLTVWLGNLFHEYDLDLTRIGEATGRFVDLLHAPPCDLVIVTNELGWGIVPADGMTRSFRDEAGRLNQRVAEKADRVELLVSGIPLVLKDNLKTT